ncbi:type I restriction enzyme, S subunit [Ectothiorhodosinus mongolicus]|uniref:Type I restriction enzyme, S subunit n=1 Tax=Ectothiorhodosinus mongolicus TaxID=233100 RepID=A0A1R3VN86_9GAMM|nr:nucleotidyltransferase domain-containing protein [Ectothiorhodosinus mongolicus]SIT65944.1 type I restriction enzyme, S subunit [Ectothiorhodosinus mongolicus]
MEKALDIEQRHAEIARDILQRFVSDKKVLVFGSRATGTAKPFSDLDLAILGEDPLPLPLMAAIREAFAESDLPYKVDIVDWAAVTPRFRDVISSHAREL